MAVGEIECMESVPCLLEKALTILASMGSGKPKTLKKLENALRPCTMVAPFLNPLEALEIAVRRSSCPDPPLVRVKHNPKKVYVTVSRKRDLVFGECLEKNARQCERDYDLALPGGETEEAIVRDALAWLRQSETREGTVEELAREFYSRCQKRVDRTALDVVLRLQAQGYLKIQGASVSYSLPRFGYQSRSLEHVHSYSKSFFGMTSTLQLCQHENDDSEEVEWRKSSLEWLLEEVYNIDSHTERQWGSVAAGFLDDDVLGSSLMMSGGDELEDNLRNVLVLYFLASMPPSERPSSLDGLLAVVKPEHLLCAVTPSRVFHLSLGQLPRRLVKSTKVKAKGRGRGRRDGVGKTDLAVGVAPGEILARKQIPLTPEGLLGIDVHVTQQTPSSDPPACPRGQGAPMDSSSAWCDRNKQRAVGFSKVFAATLTKEFSYWAQRRNAVPVPASEGEREEVISRVLDWVDSYRPSGCHGDSSDPAKACKVNGDLKSVKQLQNELILLCAIKARRISPSSVVRCLQRRGYLSVTLGSTPEVTYRLPAVKPGLGPKDGSAPWRRQADDFRQAVTESHSAYLERAFPPEKGGTSKFPSSSRQKMRKRKQLLGRKCQQQNKKQKTHWIL